MNIYKYFYRSKPIRTRFSFYLKIHIYILHIYTQKNEICLYICVSPPHMFDVCYYYIRLPYIPPYTCVVASLLIIHAYDICGHLFTFLIFTTNVIIWNYIGKGLRRRVYMASLLTCTTQVRLLYVHMYYVYIYQRSKPSDNMVWEYFLLSLKKYWHWTDIPNLLEL